MEQKPGWKTTEFWLALIAVIAGALPSSGLFATDSTALKVCGLVVSVLAALGYGAMRGSIKRSGVLLPLAMIASLSACSATPTDGVQRLLEVTRSVGPVAMEYVGAQCLEQAKACGEVGPNSCPGWQKCAAVRETLMRSLAMVYRGCLLAMQESVLGRVQAAADALAEATKAFAAASKLIDEMGMWGAR